jgi:hypothetical protein
MIGVLDLNVIFQILMIGTDTKLSETLSFGSRIGVLSICFASFFLFEVLCVGGHIFVLFLLTVF